MNKFAVVSAAALLGVAALSSTGAEARGRGGLALGLIGGLAAGALIGAAVSDAHAGPGYGYGYPAPAYGDVEDAPVVRYRPRPVRVYEEEAPVYETRRVYDERPVGYAPAGYGWRRHCDRPHGYGGW